MSLHQYLILNSKNYFAIAEEYVTLSKVFKKETFLEKLSLWVEMLIYPLVMLTCIFVYEQEFSIFTLMTIHKTVSLWFDWVKYNDMSTDIHDWIKIVRSNGGPFISTNDPKYHTYIYADGMQRLYNTFPVLSKKGTKRL